MSAVILGWGSLIWDPRDLEQCLVGPWRTGGPVLPIEFARISGDGRLTLVVDLAAGVPVPTRFVESSRQQSEATVADLRAREQTSIKYIGYVSRQNGTRHGREERVVRAIEDWADKVAVDGVVWTDLPANFCKRCGAEFSAQAAVDYLMSLKDPAREKALEYIAKAPPEVDTPVRRLLKSKGVL